MRSSASQLGKRFVQNTGDRQKFISLSRDYRHGDEKVLPYPQMSPKGRALHKMCKLLAVYQTGVVIAPRFTDPALYLMRAQQKAVFTVDKRELSACIAAQDGSNVFDYWRTGSCFDLALEYTGDVSFWINPRISDLSQHAENIIAGYVGESVQDELLEALGKARLVRASKVPNGFWLSP